MSGDTMQVDPPPSTDPVPQLQVTPQPASGKKGPTGVGPRTNYSRVNTGQPPPALPPPPPFAEPPKLGYAMIMKTPTVAELKLAALQGGLSQAKLAEEASRHASDCSCEGCCKKREEAKKESSQHKVAFDSKYCRDLAQVGMQVAAHLRKEASAGPSSVPESTASASGKYPPSFGHSSQAPSIKPSLGAVAATGAPQGAVIEESISMGSEGKRASSEPSGLPESTGPQDSGKPIGGQPPSGPESLINSNQAAIDATQRDAYASRKKDLRMWLKEEPLSSASDTTLLNAFSHGVDTAKVSADVAAVAAAPGRLRALASRIKGLGEGALEKGQQFGRDLAGRGAHSKEDVAAAKALSEKLVHGADKFEPEMKQWATMPNFTQGRLDKMIAENAAHRTDAMGKLLPMVAANKEKQKSALKTLGAVAGIGGASAGGLGLGVHAYRKNKDEEHTAADLSIKTASATVLLEQLEKEALHGR